MSYGLGVDLGVSFSKAAVRRLHRDIEMVSLGDQSVVMPSAVHLREDGQLVTGDSAERAAAGDPTRLAREVKRRLGDPTPLMLGGTPHLPTTLLAAMLSDVVRAATRVEGWPPREVVLTCPAVWGPYRRDQFAEVYRLAGLGNVRTTTEPEAAAACYAERRMLVDGEVVVVYDLGGRTFDATVLRARRGGADVLGTSEGLENLGGFDIDRAMLELVDLALGGAVSGLDPSDPGAVAALTRLRRDCVLAKEALSTHVDTVVSVFLSSGPQQVRLHRGQFEGAIRPLVRSTLHAVRRAIHSSGITIADVSAVLLVGGSSRIPLVASMITDELGLPVRADTHPEHTVALGAAALTAAAPLSFVRSTSGAADVAPPGPVRPTVARRHSVRRRAMAGLALAGAATAVMIAVSSADRPASGPLAQRPSEGEGIPSVTTSPASGGTTASTTGGPSSAQRPSSFDPAARYQITNELTGQVLELPGDNAARSSGILITLWRDQDAADQYWRIRPVEGGRFVSVVNAFSGRALAVQGRSTDDYAPLEQTVADPADPDQQWQLRDAGRGAVWIVNRRSGKALDIWGDDLATADGRTVEQWTLRPDARDQRWVITP